MTKVARINTVILAEAIRPMGGRIFDMPDHYISAMVEARQLRREQALRAQRNAVARADARRKEET